MTGVLDRTAPGVRITRLTDERAASGEPLDFSARLLGFVFEDAERKTDKVTLQLDNHDLALFEREDLQGGTTLEVSWGYPGSMAVPRRVVVRKLKGFATLTVEGQALSVLLHREVKSRTWHHMTRSAVAREIAKESGYEGERLHIEDTREVFETLCQSGETDARFLRRLAAREEFEFFVDETGFHFHARRQDAAPTHVFVWNRDPSQGNVLSLDVESDLTRRTGRVTVKGRDPLRKTTIATATSNETAQRSTLAEVVEVVDPETGQTSLQTRNATASVHASAASTEAQARRECEARFRRAERATTKLSLQVVGDPTLHAKSIVEVHGISGLLSGKYYVTEVRHVVSSSGYTCDLRLVRDGSGRRARPTAQAQEGEKNQARPRRGGELLAVEVVDPETGQTHIEYRSDRCELGRQDPEGPSGNKE